MTGSGAAPGDRAAAAVRAEFPPARYWRRWCDDAAPALAVLADAVVQDPPPRPVLPPPGPDGHTEPAYRVLIVEDDLSQGLFAESVLTGAGMQALLVPVASEVIASMVTFQPDLVLMDLHMPGMEGTEVTSLIRGHAGFAHVPVVFLTGDSNPERQLEALDLGADDFLSKPVRPRHLIAAVESRVRRARMLGLQRAGEGRPAAGGLHARGHMLQLLNASIPGPSRGALFFIEVEGTHALRDRFGYAGLESLLADAGRRLVEVAGDHPVARLSDNMFLVFANDLAGVAVPDWARRLRDGLGAHLFVLHGETLRLRALVGHGALEAGFEDATSALAATEQALRDARSSPVGIAGHRTAPPAPADGAALAAVREALAGKQFELAYQPIVAVAGGDTAQYQTLLRMRDAQGVLRTAAEILPAAAEAGLLQEIDQRVLLHAIEVLQGRRTQRRPLRLFVSQSPRTLAREGYADWVVETLAAHDVDGAWLVVDVRQDDAIVHAVALKEFCAAMVPAGIQLCLGQYEAGREADALLAQLPLGFVRLAARYSGRLGEVAVRDEMRAAIERAHRLGLQVIGQHVEDPQAAATLWMSGVDYIQGNLVQQAADGLEFDFHTAVL